MATSTPTARWRDSRGALKQSYRITQERPKYQRPSKGDPFAYLAACAYLIPAFASVALGGTMTASAILAPCVAAIVLIALWRPVGVAIAFLAAGLALAWMSPHHDWVFDAAIAAMWGTAVWALQSRGNNIPATSVTEGFLES